MSLTRIYMFCFAFVDKSIIKSIDTGLTMHVESIDSVRKLKSLFFQFISQADVSRDLKDS